ncbi:MAG: hypothetical protein AMJ60_10895 [Desulfobacterales bacterium SG8_35]|nr:MAG: hypothetical protein AMJ60_10895 [Desulfobacterales bacterium SG8_35]
MPEKFFVKTSNPIFPFKNVHLTLKVYNSLLQTKRFLTAGDKWMYLIGLFVMQEGRAETVAPLQAAVGGIDLKAGWCRKANFFRQ